MAHKEYYRGWRRDLFAIGRPHISKVKFECSPGLKIPTIDAVAIPTPHIPPQKRLQKKEPFMKELLFRLALAKKFPRLFWPQHYYNNNPSDYAIAHKKPERFFGPHSPT